MAYGFYDKKPEPENNMKNKILLLISVLTISFIILLLSVKGQAGSTIYYQSVSSRDTFLGGPFENSGSTSRFALVEAIVENGSFSFTPQQAAFASPDISAFNGKAFSLFAPGVSFAGVPLYVIGNFFGIPQLSTFLLNIFFGVLNIYLVYYLARKFGAGLYASLTAGFLSMFATNAYTYSLSLTQHTMTSSALLLAVALSAGSLKWYKPILLGAVTGAAIMVDVINGLFLAPVLLYVFVKHLSVSTTANKIRVSFNPAIFTFIAGILPFLAVFGYYNYMLTGSPTRLAQFIGNAKIETSGNFPQIQQNKFAEENVKKISLPFESRRILNGVQVLLTSEERSWLYYSPVLLFGLLGFVSVYKKSSKKDQIAIIAGTIGVSVLAYAMFIDPWGGWAFGARYLIPSAMLTAIGIGLFLEKFKGNKMLIPVFVVAAIYSIYISTIGAYTTSTVPPRIEAETMVVPTSWGINYNYDLISKGENSSLIYHLFVESFATSMQHIYFVTVTISIVFILIFLPIYTDKFKFLKRGK